MKNKPLLVLILVVLLMSGCITPIQSPPGQPTPVPAVETPAALAEAASSIVQESLTAHPWQWTTFVSPAEQFAVATPQKYQLTFNADGTVIIGADCNNVQGQYTLDDSNNISIQVGPTTLMACPDDSRAEQFAQLLGGTAIIEIAEEGMLLGLTNGSNSMLFSAALPTASELCGEQALALNTIEDTLEPKVSAELDQMLVGFLQVGYRSAPGAAMLIITPDGRYFKSTGVADVTTCAPLPADSAYQIGSNTKLMTSVIIFQLQEEGVLATADLLSKWLPELAATLPNGDQITIDMLLTHTSGLYDYFDVQTNAGAIADGTHDKAMLTRAFTPEDLVKRVADSGQMYFAPGAEGQWHYSNTGYILLGLVIEKATGKSYEENLRTRIFEPLGLQQTYLLTGQPEPGTLPQAYYQPPFSYTTSEWNASQGWSAGAVVSTPDDFAVFLKTLFTGKLYQQPATLDLMKAHSAAGVDALGPGTIYAHGMLDNQGVLGHGGQTLGFQSDGGYIPDKDVTIVIWSNSATNMVTRTAIPTIAALVAGNEQ